MKDILFIGASFLHNTWEADIREMSMSFTLDEHHPYRSFTVSAQEMILLLLLAIYACR